MGNTAIRLMERAVQSTVEASAKPRRIGLDSKQRLAKTTAALDSFGTCRHATGQFVSPGVGCGNHYRLPWAVSVVVVVVVAVVVAAAAATLAIAVPVRLFLMTCQH